MLLRMLRSLARGNNTAAARDDDAPLAIAERLDRASAAAPLEMHERILYGDMKVGDRDLLELVHSALEESRSFMLRRKQLHRPLSSYFLVQYYLHTLGIEGARAECGVFTGVSALIACRAARMRIPSYSGAGLHLVDSFEGLADPTEEDRFEGYEPTPDSPFGRGAYLAPIERARKTLRDFPDVAFHKGWIPEVFAQLPATQWAFVHLDVDHHDPTYAGLEYFYPKLAAGGVILCDDYGSPTFPGAHRAWDRYCEENGLPYVVLDTGQAVILKT